MQSFDRKLIVGVETEFGLTNESLKYYSASELHLDSQTNEFLPNGMRLYYDGTIQRDRDRLEAATAEAPDPLYGVACLKASIARAAEILPDGVRVFLNNVDTDNQTWGTHENYLCTSDAFSKAAKLAPHLASRIIYTGAGFITPKGRFLFSSRIPQLSKATAEQTTSYIHRALVNTRDQSHTVDDHLRRLHIICGESNVLDHANFLKLGTTAVVLKLIEDDHLPDVSMKLEQCLPFAKSLNAAPMRVMECATHGTTVQRALEIQHIYLKKAKDIYGDIQEPWLGMLFELWEETLFNIEKDPWRLLGKVDWITKCWLLEESKVDKGRFSNDQFWAAELSYSEYESKYDTSIQKILTEEGYLNPLIRDDVINSLINEPPPSTRAHGRGRCLNIINEAPNSHLERSGWNFLEFKARDSVWQIDLGDPQSDHEDAVRELVKLLATGKHIGKSITRIDPYCIMHSKFDARL